MKASKFSFFLLKIRIVFSTLHKMFWTLTSTSHSSFSTINHQNGSLSYTIVERFDVHVSHDMRLPTMWNVRPAKAQISLRIRAVWSEHLHVSWTFYDSPASYRLLTKHQFAFPKLKRRLHGLVWVYPCQTPHCWKLHVVTHLLLWSLVWTNTRGFGIIYTQT